MCLGEGADCKLRIIVRRMILITYKAMMLIEVTTPNSRSIWFGTRIKAANPRLCHTKAKAMRLIRTGQKKKVFVIDFMPL